MAERGAGPDKDGHRIAGLGAELVDDPAGKEEPDAVRDLEADDDVAVVDVIDGLECGGDAWEPTHEGKMEQGLDQRQGGAVHVVDGGGGKEQGADEPSDIGLIWG